MLILSRTARVFARTRAVNFSMRADGLVQLVRDELGADPFNEDVFCFFNVRRNRVFLLVWDRNGFWVMSKRLERGRFEQLDSRTSWLELAREDLVRLLAGIDTKSARFRSNFVRDVRIQSRAADEDLRPSR
jgi:transposase